MISDVLEQALISLNVAEAFLEKEWHDPMKCWAQKRLMKAREEIRNVIKQTTCHDPKN